MRYAVDPRQKTLFDPAEGLFSPIALKKLRGDWPGLFRVQILHLLPAGRLGERFHPRLGCHTKELYSMAGLIFLKEAFDLTTAEAVDRFMFDGRYHFALNVDPVRATMSEATYYRHQKFFEEDDLAAGIFEQVTCSFVEALELDISRQRLDSTHIFSDMATFGRTKLMGVTIKRFLAALGRHERALYDTLAEDLRRRYASAQGKLFADWKGPGKSLRQSVAEDLLFLVERFQGETAVTGRTTYKAMVRVLGEQCDVACGKVTVKKKTGGDVLQNPSDEDATYDGHKGPGYQAQLSETCSPENEEQLVVACIPETASRPDEDAVEPVLDQLEKNQNVPELLLADGNYGSDNNVQKAAERGVDLQAPVKGKVAEETIHALNIDDFVVAEEAETVERCPTGCVPKTSLHDPKTGKTTTLMNAADCGQCPHQQECPVKAVRGEFSLTHTAKSRRLAARRREQATDAFRENYRIRAGGESVNSGLKRKTGLGRLRKRGMISVRMAVFLKVAGWNMFRALAILRKRGIRDFVAASAHFCPDFHLFLRLVAALGAILCTRPCLEEPNGGFVKFQRPPLRHAA
jgi:hypothetical protein